MIINPVRYIFKLYEQLAPIQEPKAIKEIIEREDLTTNQKVSLIAGYLKNGLDHGNW